MASNYIPSQKHDHYVRTEDLGPFVEKVEELKRDGIPTNIIAYRFDISVSVLNRRLRNYRKLMEVK